MSQSFARILREMALWVVASLVCPGKNESHTHSFFLARITPSLNALSILVRAGAYHPSPCALQLLLEFQYMGVR